MKGGRPKLDKALPISQSEPSGLPVASQSEASGNPNQEPLTNNQTTSAVKKPARRKFHFSDADMQIAALIENGIRALLPDIKYPKMEAWANTVRLMVEQDKRTHQEIDDLFAWANADDFWQTNILSPSKLRKQWDQLTIKRKSKMNGGSLRFNPPKSDEALADWAKKNGFSKPRPGESHWQYRDRLQAEINERDQI